MTAKQTPVIITSEALRDVYFWIIVVPLQFSNKRFYHSKSKQNVALIKITVMTGGLHLDMMPYSYLNNLLGYTIGILFKNYI